MLKTIPQLGGRSRLSIQPSSDALNPISGVEAAGQAAGIKHSSCAGWRRGSDRVDVCSIRSTEHVKGQGRAHSFEAANVARAGGAASTLGFNSEFDPPARARREAVPG